MNEQIEAIRAEIERRINEYDTIIESQPDSNRSERDAWKWAEDKSLLSFIDALPEEPAPKGYDDAYLNECIAKASKTWEGVDVDKYMDEVRGNRPKLSDDLEEAAEKYENEHTFHKYEGGYYSDITMSEAFKAGAKWQKEQMMDEWLKDRDGCFWDGVEEGKKAMEKQIMMDGNVILAEEDFDAEKEKSMKWGYNLCKEQMMKDAVEGVVIKTDKHTSVRYKSFYGTDRYFYGIADKQFKPGDKVWISIVKEDKR